MPAADDGPPRRALDFRGRADHGPIRPDRRPPVADPALFRRNAAAAALVSSAVLGAASRFLDQPAGGRPAQLLAALQEHPGRSLASAVLFVLYALPTMIGALGLAHLLRGRFPALSNVGATLAVVGAFADAVAGSFSLVYVQMAQHRISA